MTLQLLAMIGKPHPSFPYNEYLVFDYAEANALLYDCHFSKKPEIIFLKKTIKKRRKFYDDIRLIHAFSTALFASGYKKIKKSTLDNVMLTIFNDREKKSLFSHTFIHSTARITYHKRHSDMDKYVKKYFDNEAIEYLDIGCCPEEHGAPTTEDTSKILPQAKITAIDIIYPPNFQPKNPAVTYLMENLIPMPLPEQKFDVIRYVNIELFFNPKTKALVQKKLIRALKPNGLLIKGRESQGYQIYKKI